MAAPSTEELQVLKQFRKHLEDGNVRLNEREGRDMSLIRFLRARDMNIPNALDMLKKYLAWYKEEDMENILAWQPPDYFHKAFQFDFEGKSKDGDCPIIIYWFGKWDVRKCVEAGDGVASLRYFNQMFFKGIERMEEMTKERGKSDTRPEVTQFIGIVDFEGFGLRQLTSKQNVEVLLSLARTFEANYPERVKVAYFINTPKVFSLLFALLRPFLGEATVSKIDVYDSNESKWKPALLKYINPDQLPLYMGGTNPNSCKFMGSGNVDTNSNNQLNVRAEFNIPAGRNVELDVEVANENSVLRWNFNIEAYDIGFAVLYKPKNPVYPYKKLEGGHSGSIVCEKSGTYTLVFDNKYSKMRSKKIHYNVWIHDTESDIAHGGIQSSI